MKFVGSVLIVLLLVSFSYAQELKDSSACITIQSGSAAKMVVELEQCRIKTQQLENLTSQNTTLIKEVGDYADIVKLFEQKEELYKQIILLQQQQIVAAEKGMKDLEEHGKFIQTSYKELLKDAKPNPVWEFFKSLLGMGAGVALGYGLGH